MTTDTARGLTAAGAIHDMTQINQMSGTIIGACIRIHQKLGPGMYEHVYESILERDLRRIEYTVERQKAFPLEFEGLVFDEAFRADLIVNGRILLEIKSAAAIALAHEKQTVTYQRILRLPLALILNFGAPYMKDGIKRFVL